MSTPLPIIELSRSNNGMLHIGVHEFDERGYGVRAYVLVSQDENIADRVMLRRFHDMVRLMGDSVRVDPEVDCPNCMDLGIHPFEPDAICSGRDSICEMIHQAENASLPLTSHY